MCHPLLKLAIFTTLFLYVPVVWSQNDPQADRLMQNIRQALENGNCESAQRNYNSWRGFTGETDQNIERLIRDCFATQVPDSNLNGDNGTGVLVPPARTPKVFSSFGIKGGLNLSNISNNTTDIHFSPQMKSGFHGGLSLNLRFGSQTGDKINRGIFGLQSELLFSNQGFMVDDNAINFNYVTVPLMLKLHFGNSSSRQNFHIEFGPSFSYLVAVSPSSTVIGNEYDIRLSDLTNGKDIGVSAGIGYETDFGLVIGARYTHGLSDMANNLLWKNSVIAVSLGWKFN
jgi:hypothetical protein